jgi:uncharacterized protein (DUF983 family)
MDCRCPECGGGLVFPGLVEADQAAKKRRGRRYSALAIYCRYCSHGHVKARRKSLKSMLKRR